jgi:iron complex transport system substrate-binding protein
MTSRLAVTVALVVVVAVAPATALAQSDGSCSFPVEQTDATGETVRVAEEPESVVTLNPSAAQAMFEIGAWDKMIGATRHAANLEGFEDIENVSGAGETINNEAVVGLEPDLVLAPNTVQNDTVSTLRSANLTIYRFREARSIDDVKAKTRLIGRLTGECEGAQATVEWMDERLAVVDEATADADRPTAIYVFFGYTAGEETFISELIERAGATNGAAAAGIRSYKPINEEVLVSQDPDWLILNTDSPDVPDGAGYNSTTAVREDQIVVVDTNYLNRPGPRVVYAVEEMVKAFHPEAYAEANATETPTAELTTPAPSTPTNTDTPTTEGSDGPGFGPVVALVALVAASLLARGNP